MTLSINFLLFTIGCRDLILPFFVQLKFWRVCEHIENLVFEFLSCSFMCNRVQTCTPHRLDAKHQGSWWKGSWPALFRMELLLATRFPPANSKSILVLSVLALQGLVISNEIRTWKKWANIPWGFLKQYYRYTHTVSHIHPPTQSLTHTQYTVAHIHSLTRTHTHSHTHTHTRLLKTQ